MAVLGRNSTILQRLWLNRGRINHQGRKRRYRIARTQSAAAPGDYGSGRPIRRILGSSLRYFLPYLHFGRTAVRAVYFNKFNRIAWIKRRYKGTPRNGTFFRLADLIAGGRSSVTSWREREGQDSTLHKMKKDHGIAAAVPAVAGHGVRTLSPHCLRHAHTRWMIARYSGGVNGTNNNHD